MVPEGSDVGNTVTFRYRDGTEHVLLVEDGDSLMNAAFFAGLPGDYLQIMWAADNTNLQLQTIAAGVSPTHPLSPSVIVSVTQV